MSLPYWQYARWGVALLIVLAAVGTGFHMARSATYTDAEVGSFVYNGPWYTDKFGAEDASAKTRAYTAVVGLLALSRQETLYYLAHDDSDGHPISSDYVYEISGEDLPARWWSITLYGEDHFLMPNQHDKYSVKATELSRSTEGTFKVILSREPQPGNWIPIVGEGEELSLLLRMYNPDDGVIERLDEIKLPEIRRVRKAS